MLRMILVSPPANAVLTSADAKARLNIGSEVPDAVMDAYIMAATQWIDGVDGWLGRALITQSWQAMLDQWPTECGGKIMIPLPPLQSVDEVSYLDVDGLATVIDPVTYQVVQGQRPYLIPAFGAAWPAATTRTDAISITFTAGYGDNDTDVPEPIRTGIALMCGGMSSMSTRRLQVALEREEGIGETRYTPSVNANEEISTAVENLLSVYRVTWV